MPYESTMTVVEPQREGSGRLEFLDDESFLTEGCQGDEGYVYYVPGDCPEARKLRDIIVIQVAGLVIFTLVVNGSFAGTVYRCLHVYARSGPQPSRTVSWLVLSSFVLPGIPRWRLSPRWP